MLNIISRVVLLPTAWNYIETIFSFLYTVIIVDKQLNKIKILKKIKRIISKVNHDIYIPMKQGIFILNKAND